MNVCMIVPELIQDDKFSLEETYKLSSIPRFVTSI